MDKATGASGGPKSSTAWFNGRDPALLRVYVIGRWGWLLSRDEYARIVDGAR